MASHFSFELPLANGVSLDPRVIELHADIIYAMGLICGYCKEYDNAMLLLTKAAELYGVASGSSSCKYANTLYYLGETLSSIGHSNAAGERYRVAASIYRKHMSSWRE